MECPHGHKSPIPKTSSTATQDSETKADMNGHGNALMDAIVPFPRRPQPPPSETSSVPVLRHITVHLLRHPPQAKRSATPTTRSWPPRQSTCRQPCCHALASRDDAKPRIEGNTPQHPRAMHETQHHCGGHTSKCSCEPKQLRVQAHAATMPRI